MSKSSSKCLLQLQSGVPHVVGVANNVDKLVYSTDPRNRRRYDLLELRADDPRIRKHPRVTKRLLPEIGHPKILTVRDESQGGAQGITLTKRAEIYLDFMANAKKYGIVAIDIEVDLLDNPAFQEVLWFANELNIGLIASHHDFSSYAPSLGDLLKRLKLAVGMYHAAVFKVAVNATNIRELRRVGKLFCHPAVVENRIKLSAMSINPANTELSRCSYGTCGATRLTKKPIVSALNYGRLLHDPDPKVTAQPTVDELRMAFLSGLDYSLAKLE
ncbi:MAG: Type 3-dehydroquinase [Candidatus Parcubacteria bacterium]|jgi:3-dehydroquinate dehydratase type I